VKIVPVEIAPVEIVPVEIVPFEIVPFEIVPVKIVPVFRLCLLASQVMNDHSGYHFPLSFSPEFHDFHHLRYSKISATRFFLYHCQFILGFIPRMAGWVYGTGFMEQTGATISKIMIIC
jgi:hypothetical protein